MRGEVVTSPDITPPLLVQRHDAVVLVLRRRLGGVAGGGVAHEVRLDAPESVVVGVRVGDRRVVDADDLAEALVARRTLEVLAALLLLRRRLLVAVGAVASAARRQ